VTRFLAFTHHDNKGSIMTRSAVIAATVLALGAGLSATPAAAQTTFGLDLAANNAYFWRGLTYTNKFVLQPDAYLTIPIGPASFTAGGWGNIEPGQYNNFTNDLSEGAGVASFDLTEFDWWGEFNLPVGVATLTAGATGYIFPNDSVKVAANIANGAYYGYTSANNTIEIYGKVALNVLLSPKLAVWYDVDKIDGAYFEGSIGHGIPLGVTTLNLGALAGFSANQGCKPDALGACTVSGNFYDDGLTHVDLSASVGIPAGPVTITPNIHGIITNDQWTKVSSPTKLNEGFKVLFGATVSWSKALGGAKK
jgi:hypothetical protein